VISTTPSASAALDHDVIDATLDAAAG